MTWPIISNSILNLQCLCFQRFWSIVLSGRPCWLFYFYFHFRSNISAACFLCILLYLKFQLLLKRYFGAFVQFKTMCSEQTNNGNSIYSQKLFLSIPIWEDYIQLYFSVPAMRISFYLFSAFLCTLVVGQQNLLIGQQEEKLAEPLAIKIDKHCSSQYLIFYLDLFLILILIHYLSNLKKT